DTVLGDLSEIGYDAEWHCIPASTVGAPHLRDRVWIVAYPARQQARPAGSRGGGIAAQEAGALAASSAGGCDDLLSYPQLPRLERTGLRGAIADSPEWLPEPGVCRVVDGVSDGVDRRLLALGNAVVPAVVEAIGRAMM